MRTTILVRIIWASCALLVAGVGASCEGSLMGANGGADADDTAPGGQPDVRDDATTEDGGPFGVDVEPDSGPWTPDVPDRPDVPWRPDVRPDDPVEPPIPLCCEGDFDCPDGAMCVPGAQVCKRLAGLGPEQCWHKRSCKGGEVCLGARVCPCDAACDMEDRPGTCTSELPDGCCKHKQDCAQGESCIKPEGVCKPNQGIEPGFCWRDAHCDDGFHCQGASICPCGADCIMEDRPGECVPDEPSDGCCGPGYGPCAAGEICLPGAQVCKAIGQLPPNRCWTAGQCAPGYDCQGAYLCPCGELCDAPDKPGFCQPPATDGCCSDSGGCTDASEVCVTPAWVCRDTSWLGPGQCWNDAQCGGNERCVGVSVCPCGYECGMMESPGTCQPEEPAGCCDEAGGCPDPEETCIYPPAVCKSGADLWPGGCWTGADCASGETCEGAFICPCGAMCDAPDSPGKCVADNPSGCCDADGWCPGDGQVCVWGPNVCEETSDLGPGQCWTDAQCWPGATCEGGNICPCGALCFAADWPGECVDGGGDPCCESELDCWMNSDTFGDVCVPGAQVCKSPSELPAGTCWTDAQCAAGDSCEGASICPCGASCLLPDYPGKCQPQVPPICCQADSDCATPSGEPAVCVPGAQVCKSAWELPPGACWTDSSCGPGATCEGAMVCPCDADCDMQDTPGQCVEDLPPGCCNVDMDCVSSAGELGTCVPGANVCKSPTAPGQCWVDSDCDAGYECRDAIVCPCGALCIIADEAGQCMPAASDGCCEGQDGCPSGQTCAVDAGVCKSTGELGPGQCWGDADCADGTSCTGAAVCPCGFLCLFDETPGSCQ